MCLPHLPLNSQSEMRHVTVHTVFCDGNELLINERSLTIAWSTEWFDVTLQRVAQVTWQPFW